MTQFYRKTKILEVEGIEAICIEEHIDEEIICVERLGSQQLS